MQIFLKSYKYANSQSNQIKAKFKQVLVVVQDFANMQICRKFKEPCKEMQSNMQITNTFQIAQLCACKADQGQVQMGSCCSDANSGKEGAKRLMPPVKF